MKRRLYLCCAAVLALTAAFLTMRAQHTVPVLVATHDVRSGTQLSSADVEVVRMHEDSVPADALSAGEAASGKFVAWPLTSGEPVLSHTLADARSTVSMTAGLDVPAGYRAVAIPVQPAAAVGGMLSPGDRVDVYATSNHAGNASTATGSADPSAGGNPLPPATLLGQHLLVLQLRSDQGQELGSQTQDGSSVHGLNFGSGKLGSVVLAIPAADVTQYATAAVDSTMYVALSVT